MCKINNIENMNLTSFPRIFFFGRKLYCRYLLSSLEFDQIAAVDCGRIHLEEWITSIRSLSSIGFYTLELHVAAIFYGKTHYFYMAMFNSKLLVYRILYLKWLDQIPLTYRQVKRRRLHWRYVNLHAPFRKLWCS